MSSGLECAFYNVGKKPSGDEWFYLLQDYNCPVGTWDWREFATAYGPFPTVDKAIQHLQSNHANPGGWSQDPEGRPRDPDALEGALKEAFADARQRGTADPFAWPRFPGSR